jgi:hypothetical protein
LTVLGIHIITWVGIVLIAAGTIFTIFGQQVINDRSSSVISEKTTKIEKLANKNIELSEEVTSLAKKNAEMNETLRKYVTGGEAYCFINTYFEVGHKDNLVSFSLAHKGSFPLYDVDLIVYDVSKRSDLTAKMKIHKNHTEEEWATLQKERDVIGEFYAIRQQTIVFKHHFPTIAVGATFMPIYRFELPNDRNEQKYLVKIYARNGATTQPIHFLKVKDKWRMSMRVQQYDNEKHHVVELENDLDPDVSLSEDYAGE